MTISFSCSKCGKTYTAGTEISGKGMKCAQCGHVQRIPVAKQEIAWARPVETSPVDDSLYEPEPEAPVRSSVRGSLKSSKVKINSKVIWAVCGVGLVGCLLIIALIVGPQVYRGLSLDARGFVERQPSWSAPGSRSEGASSSGSHPSRSAGLPAVGVFVVRPEFLVQGQPLAAGTAFAAKWEGEARPILLTALHLFGPAGGLNFALAGEQLPGAVASVTLRDLATDAEIGRGGSAILLRGCYPLGRDAAGDVAAFWLTPDVRLSPVPLARELPNSGHRVWLAGQTIDAPNAPQQLFAATVSEANQTRLVYVFDRRIELQATSGAPVVNAAGELVGIHLGGGEQLGKSMGIANPVTSIREKLGSALRAEARAR